MYYHISPTLEILSGPHAADSAYVRNLTRCGTPEVLNLADYGLVPEVREPLGEGQKHGAPIVSAEAVTLPAVARTAEELAAELNARRAVMSCSPAQGQLALLQAGILDALEAWVATQSREVQIEYAARTVWYRTWPLVASAGAAMGLSDAQMDDLFALAATL